MGVKIKVEITTKDGKKLTLNETEAKEIFNQLEPLFAKRTNAIAYPWIVQPYATRDWITWYDYKCSGSVSDNASIKMSYFCE